MQKGQIECVNSATGVTDRDGATTYMAGVIDLIDRGAEPRKGIPGDHMPVFRRWLPASCVADRVSTVITRSGRARFGRLPWEVLNWFVTRLDGTLCFVDCEQFV